MPKTMRTSSELPDEATGSHRENASQSAPAQISLDLIDPQYIADLVADGYEQLRRAVAVHGGQKKVALEMGESLDYNSKVNEGLNRKGDRHAFFDWLIPLLLDPRSEPVLMEFFCRIAKRQMGRRIGSATAEQQLRQLVRRAREYGRAGDDLLALVGGDLGVDPSELGK